MTNKPSKKPGPAKGSTYLADEGDRLVTVSVRLRKRTIDKLHKLGRITLLCRDAIEDKYGR